MKIRWPWRRRNPDATSGGAQALADADRNLEHARGRWPHVLERADAMRELRHQNGFAESMELAYALKSERDRRDR